MKRTILITTALAAAAAIAVSAADDKEKTKDKDPQKEKETSSEKADKKDGQTEAARPNPDRADRPGGPGGPGGPSRRSGGASSGGQFRGPGERPEGGGSGLSEMDANGDGSVSRAEFLAQNIERFDEMWTRLDADASGSLSGAELTAMGDRERGQAPGAFGRGPGFPGGRPPGEPGGPGGFRGAPNFEEMDVNADGSVTLEEFFASSQERQKRFFEMLDVSGDGKITKDEAQEAMEQMRERFGAGPGPGGPDGDRPPRGQGPRPGEGSSPRPPRPSADN